MSNSDCLRIMLGMLSTTYSIMIIKYHKMDAQIITLHQIEPSPAVADLEKLETWVI